jgi:hypothetical protein
MWDTAWDQIVLRTKADHFTAPWAGTVPTDVGTRIANGPPAGATLSGVLTSSSQFRAAAGIRLARVPH